MRKPERPAASRPPPLPTARLNDAERLACLRLIRSENVGPTAFRVLINQFGGAQAALAVLPKLAQRGGGRRPIRLCSAAAAEAELQAAEDIGARPVFTIEPGYPSALAVIDVPPPMLYLKGAEHLLSRPMVAIVGSRLASAAGQNLARRFASGLGESGYVVVSGLALGIDTAAHHAALETGTVAVLAGGIDSIYPQQNAGLHALIGANGCLVSEQPPGFQPRGQEFPRRNRIISGLSRAVVIVEAARRSGSLITARMAGEQGREVFAVPGHPLDTRAEGTNQLLKDGATIATEASDIITALQMLGGPQFAALGQTYVAPAYVVPAVTQSSLAHFDGGGAKHGRNWGAPAVVGDGQTVGSVGDDERAIVVNSLGVAPIDVDNLVRATQLPIACVQTVLLELVLAGRVEFHGSQLVSLTVQQN